MSESKAPFTDASSDVVHLPDSPCPTCDALIVLPLATPKHPHVDEHTVFIYDPEHGTRERSWLIQLDQFKRLHHHWPDDSLTTHIRTQTGSGTQRKRNWIPEGYGCPECRSSIHNWDLWKKARQRKHT